MFATIRALFGAVHPYQEIETSIGADLEAALADRLQTMSLTCKRTCTSTGPQPGIVADQDTKRQADQDHRYQFEPKLSQVRGQSRLSTDISQTTPEQKNISSPLWNPTPMKDRPVIVALKSTEAPVSPPRSRHSTRTRRRMGTHTTHTVLHTNEPQQGQPQRHECANNAANSWSIAVGQQSDMQTNKQNIDQNKYLLFPVDVPPKNTPQFMGHDSRPDQEASVPQTHTTAVLEAPPQGAGAGLFATNTPPYIPCQHVTDTPTNIPTDTSCHIPYQPAFAIPPCFFAAKPPLPPAAIQGATGRPTTLWGDPIARRQPLNAARGRSSAKGSTARGPLPMVDFKELSLVHQIGEGGFGKVYLGHWKGQEVAIKLVNCRDEYMPQRQQELHREIAVMNDIPPHKNILRLLGACTSPPHLAVITEYCEHGSLYGLLHGHEQAMTLEQLLRMFLGVAQGMSHLHACKPPVLHRDLKSGNILLDSMREVKIADFGLSRSESVKQVMTGGLGTYQWMAPEVLLNQPYSCRADVYSFAIIMWESITRKLPYEGMQAVQAAMGVAQQGLRPSIPAGTPARLASLISSCWAAVPDQRPTFEVITRELDNMLQSYAEASPGLLTSTPDCWEQLNQKSGATINKADSFTTIPASLLTEDQSLRQVGEQINDSAAAASSAEVHSDQSTSITGSNYIKEDSSDGAKPLVPAVALYKAATSAQNSASVFHNPVVQATLCRPLPSSKPSISRPAGRRSLGTVVALSRAASAGPAVETCATSTADNSMGNGNGGLGSCKSLTRQNDDSFVQSPYRVYTGSQGTPQPRISGSTDVEEGTKKQEVSTASPRLLGSWFRYGLPMFTNYGARKV